MISSLRLSASTNFPLSLIEFHSIRFPIGNLPVFYVLLSLFTEGIRYRPLFFPLSRYRVSCVRHPVSSPSLFRADLRIVARISRALIPSRADAVQEQLVLLLIVALSTRSTDNRCSSCHVNTLSPSLNIYLRSSGFGTRTFVPTIELRSPDKPRIRSLLLCLLALPARERLFPRVLRAKSCHEY